MTSRIASSILSEEKKAPIRDTFLNGLRKGLLKRGFRPANTLLEYKVNDKQLYTFLIETQYRIAICIAARSRCLMLRNVGTDEIDQQISTTRYDSAIKQLDMVLKSFDILITRADAMDPGPERRAVIDELHVIEKMYERLEAHRTTLISSAQYMSDLFQ